MSPARLDIQIAAFYTLHFAARLDDAGMTSVLDNTVQVY
jgi:hypothetical protein